MWRVVNDRLIVSTLGNRYHVGRGKSAEWIAKYLNTKRAARKRKAARRIAFTLDRYPF